LLSLQPKLGHPQSLLGTKRMKIMKTSKLIIH